jgi:predicted TIM-barrel fold metal-dependent hydrolase
MEPTERVDTHIHAPPFPDPKDGNIVVPTVLKGLFLKYLRRRLGIPPCDQNPNETYIKKLSEEIKGSMYIDRGVVFGLDGVYDPGGELDTAKTRFMVTNDYVFGVLKGYGELIPGASINPMRKGAIDELERCKEKGAFLVKILPNSQGFDPADKRFIPFYRRLKELGMPLLTHSGYEFALNVKDQALGDPGRLRPALDQGTTVIIAHGGSSGIFIYEKYFDTVKGLIKTYPNVFLDTAALTLPSRVRMLLKIRKYPEIHERLLFGTDYPIPSFTAPFIFSLSPRELFKIISEKNYFDRQFLLFQALGIRFGTGGLLKPIKVYK